MQTKFMNKIKLITNSKGKKGFIKRINIKIESINSIIELYNHARDANTQLNLLISINRIRIEILNSSSSYDMNRTSKFNFIINVNLFNTLNNACLDNHITMYDLNNMTNPKPISGNINQDQLAFLIDNMSPEKSALFLSILEKPNTNFFGFKRNINKDLSHVFLAHEKKDSPGSLFESFINNNLIQYIAGNNSKIFKITPLNNDAPPFILKIENRMGAPKQIEVYVTNKLSSAKPVFIPVNASRVTTISINNQKETKNFIVCPFYEKGDLQSFAHRPQSNAMRIFNAVHIYAQMAKILNSLEKTNIFFPDMKNTNWILSKNNRLLISDTKSLRYTSIHGSYDKAASVHVNRWSRLILSSNYMNPPEYTHHSDQILSTSSHAYMLGKNLYQFLTNCSPGYLSRHSDGQQYTFEQDIFNGLYGKKLQNLILNLIKKNPDERLNMNTILIELKDVETELFKDQKNILHSTIQTLVKTSESNDPLFYHYMNELQKQENQLTELESIIITNEKLNNIHNISILVNDIINKYIRKGDQAKADRIKTCFYKISPENRILIFSNQNTESKEFRETLAEHHSCFRPTITFKDPEKTEIDERWASNSFIKFKKALDEIREHPSITEHAFTG